MDLSLSLPPQCVCEYGARVCVCVRERERLILILLVVFCESYGAMFSLAVSL